MNRLLFFSVIAFPLTLWADGERDNHPESVRRVPKIGIEVPEKVAVDLNAGLRTLQTSIEELRAKNDKHINALLPDIIIFYRAVDEALRYQEFFRPAELKTAQMMLERGLLRAKQLANGESPWTTATGLVVRGFVSDIDGSVQPYGLVIPKNYRAEGPPTRLDIWFHGRGETLSELNFLQQRSSRAGYYSPADTIVLHPYGRYSNAFKFAGEVDVLEALAATQDRYRIDPERISVRGFSMGGAACWQFAVHYSDRWFAANPGAGFSETPEFLKFFQKQELNPTWWEEKLWRMHDCNGWARNLAHCPTVAYSGENDIQKQAADIMEAALKEQQIDLVHIIGPQMGHRIDPNSARLIDEKLAALARHGRRRAPDVVRFVTYTLKYNRMKWITVTGLDQHWEQSRVIAKVHRDKKLISIGTKNITGVRVNFLPGDSPFSVSDEVTIKMDGGKEFAAGRPKSDRSFSVEMVKLGDEWSVGTHSAKTLRKKHNLQGPIDDAFMSSFLFVLPSGQSSNTQVAKWAEGEQTRAVEHWRRHFRGHVRSKRDDEVTPDDIARHNLILWGDPGNHSLLKRVMGKLPIEWNDQAITVGEKSYPASTHGLIAIYPNPLNPERYVVLNSSFTYRDFAYLNNARQVSMLPDWAVIDTRTPPGTVWPGKVVDAGFFDEQWRLSSQGPNTPK